MKQVVLRKFYCATMWLLVGTICSCTSIGPPSFPQVEDAIAPGIFLEPEGRGVLPEGVKLRKVHAKGLALTKVSEGFRGYLYNDAAWFCTIGYGHLIKKARCDGTEPQIYGKGITEPVGSQILAEDMAIAEYGVMRLVSRDLTDGQFAALVDFAFNVGLRRLEKSELLQKINAGKFDEVPPQFRRFVLAGGKRLRGLEIRREREIELFHEGASSSRGVEPDGQALPLIDIRGE